MIKKCFSLIEDRDDIKILKKMNIAMQLLGNGYAIQHKNNASLNNYLKYEIDSNYDLYELNNNKIIYLTINNYFVVIYVGEEEKIELEQKELPDEEQTDLIAYLENLNII